eukprot:TRINITY_DN7135_c0_g1_i1.p1 TRINITY_DN7135_c0_g1~~TRINITY_DN7135_c0_g1_i1.p1  ORF type:complete len:318 (-),score=47.21 TRINITY_DN7135_c0_g1_i1:125-1078(-)
MQDLPVPQIQVELISFGNFEDKNIKWPIPIPTDQEHIAYYAVITAALASLTVGGDVEVQSPTLGYGGMLVTPIVMPLDPTTGKPIDDQIYLTPNYVTLFKGKKNLAPAGMTDGLTVFCETLMMALISYSKIAENQKPTPVPTFAIPDLGLPIPTPNYFPPEYTKQFVCTPAGIDTNEPPKSPQVQEWAEFANINNSYNYARNVINKDETTPAAQPGGGTLTPDQITGDNIKQLATKDGLVVVDDPAAGPPSGYHLVALFVYPQIDHYWVRLNVNSWSHLPQGGRVSFDDYRGVAIKDPKYSRFDKYKFVTYMAAKSH